MGIRWRCALACSLRSTTFRGLSPLAPVLSSTSFLVQCGRGPVTLAPQIRWRSRFASEQGRTRESHLLYCNRSLTGRRGDYSLDSSKVDASCEQARGNDCQPACPDRNTAGNYDSARRQRDGVGPGPWTDLFRLATTARCRQAAPLSAGFGHSGPFRVAGTCQTLLANLFFNGDDHQTYP